MTRPERPKEKKNMNNEQNDPHSNFPMPSQVLPSGAATTPYRKHDRQKIAACLLAIFLGGLGIHKFYLGQSGLGILYLIFCWSGIPAIVGLIEGIIYVSQSDQEFDQKYNYA
jgi:TM2 domain-containing membrane protein YozV